ncbi:MAG: mechanosensitive ion channel [Candidatus Sericytochromatia bacterium]|nr:mechanosensitive ion channel [Candidatus Sericytochromatia bacterium]
MFDFNHFVLQGPLISTIREALLYIYMNPALIYLGAVFLLGSLLFVVFRRKVNQLEQSRLAHVGDLPTMNPVRTRSPLKLPFYTIKHRLQERISKRYTIIRKTLTLAFVALWGVALSLPFLGQLPATMVSLLVASSTVVLGIAARPFVENLISGVVILFSKHFLTGDTVTLDNQQYGTIEDISLTRTTIKLWDWRRYVVPNHRMLSKEVINHSHRQGYLMAWVSFWVAYDTDLVEMERLALQIAKENPFTQGNEPPEMWVMQLSPESIECYLAAWVKSPPDAWSWKAYSRTRIVQTLQQHGIKTHHWQVSSAEKEAAMLPPRQLQRQSVTGPLRMG